MKTKLILLLISTVLVSCSTYNAELYNDLDLSEKRITVPPGGSAVIGAIKSALKEDGWKLSIYRGPKITEGTVGEKTKLKEYNTFNSRYNLLISYTFYDHRFPDFTPIYFYDISFIDNTTGEEVMTMSGRDVIKGIVTKFRKLLDSNQ